MACRVSDTDPVLDPIRHRTKKLSRLSPSLKREGTSKASYAKRCPSSVSCAALTSHQLVTSQQLAVAFFSRGALPLDSFAPSCARGARSPNESQKQLLADRTARSLIEPMRVAPLYHRKVIGVKGMSAAILLPSTHRNPSLWVRFPAGKAAALVSQVSEKRFRPFEQIQPKRYALGFAAFAHVRTPLCVHNNPSNKSCMTPYFAQRKSGPKPASNAHAAAITQPMQARPRLLPLP